MKEKNVRNSNIELFRIVCMYLIVLCHFCIQCGIKEFNSSYNKLILFIFQSMGAFGNIGFMAITGFYIDKVKFDFIKFINLVIKITIYSIGIWAGWHIFLGRYVTVDESIASYLPIIFGAYEYLTVYLIMYLFEPLIKKMLDNISQKNHLFLCIAFTILATFPILFFGITNYVNYPLVFFYVIVIVNYLKKYSIDLIKNKRKMFFIWLCTLIIMFSYSFMILYLEQKYEWLRPYSSLWLSMKSPFVIINMIMLFYIFTTFNLRSFIINIIGKATLGIFLIHAAPSIRNYYWMDFFQTQTFGMKTPFKMLCSMLLLCLFVFFISACIEIILSLIVKLLQRKKVDILGFDIICKKINNSINSN